MQLQFTYQLEIDQKMKPILSTNMAFVMNKFHFTGFIVECEEHLGLEEHRCFLSVCADKICTKTKAISELAFPIYSTDLEISLEPFTAFDVFSGQLVQSTILVSTSISIKPQMLVSYLNTSQIL